MSSEKEPEYEPSEEELEAMRQVVEESREGLGRLAREESAADRRTFVRNLLRRLKQRLGRGKADTAEIKV